MRLFSDSCENEDKESLAGLPAFDQHSEDALVSQTLEGRIEGWSVGAERIFGYTEAEALELSAAQILWPTVQQDGQLFERIKAGKRIAYLETVLRRKNGESFEASLTIWPVREASGNSDSIKHSDTAGATPIIRGALTRVFDVTACKREEEALKNREEDLCWILALNRQTSWTADGDGRVVVLAPNWITLSGLKRRQLHGDSWVEALHPDDEAWAGKAWRRSIA